MPRLSFNYDSLLITGPLTDKRIAHYIREGRYGVDAQKKLLLCDEERNKIHAARKEEATKMKRMLSVYD